MIILLYLSLLIIGLSALLTWFFQGFALRIDWVDLPNSRSSHSIPTPRGGGLAFVFCFILVVLALSFFGLIPKSLSFILVALGSFIAVLGCVDDKISIRAKWKLLSHFVACGLAVTVFGGMPSIAIFDWTLSNPYLLNLFAMFYLTWLLNLYNFMDGIDGLAAVEAITVALSGALLYALTHHSPQSLLPLGLALSLDKTPSI